MTLALSLLDGSRSHKSQPPPFAVPRITSGSLKIFFAPWREPAQRIGAGHRAEIAATITEPEPGIDNR
jgi:hypothetical protein